MHSFFSPELLSLYFRVLGGLVLIPMKLDLTGVFGRGILALFISFYFANSNPDGSLIDLGILINFLIGLLVSFSLLFSFWSFLVFFEITESMRGMNYAIFFTSEEFANSQQLAQGIKILLFVIFLERDFLLQLIGQLGISIETTQSFDSLAFSALQLSFQSLSLGFKLLVPVASCFLLIQMVFMMINKIYPNGTFFSEVFFVKALILLIILASNL
ncbi:MAG: flagellar biosynthetic protein FliR [Candidatus Paceibacterota bacterium]